MHSVGLELQVVRAGGIGMSSKTHPILWGLWKGNMISLAGMLAVICLLWEATKVSQL